MITVNNKEYRNLVEQVGYLTNRVDEHYERDRVLADYGIRIVGSVDSVDNLPPANTYDGLYGDAYTVGTGAPYDFYIFTRPLQGETENRWLDLGQLAIQGPQGDIGPEGPVGPQGESTQWYVGQGQPYIEANVNSLYFDTTTSNIYQKQEGQWIMVANIKGNTGAQGPQGPKGEIGPQGPQGIQGENGVPGDAVNIVGILTSSSMLPDPDTVARDSAYVVEDGIGQWLYFITGLGTAESPLIWDKVAFENGTTVLVDGNPVQTFDADSKISVPSATHELAVVPTFEVNSQKVLYRNIGQSVHSAKGNAIALYIGEANTSGDTIPAGCLITNTPTKIAHAANKKYVDEQVQAAKDASVPAVSTASILYGNGANGNLFNFTWSENDAAYTIARRGAGGTLAVGTPAKDADATTKKYVDNAIANLQIKTINSKLVIGKTSIPLTDYILSGVPSIIEITPVFQSATQVGGIGIGYSSSSDKYVRIKVIDQGGTQKLAMCYKSDGTLAIVNVGPFLYVNSDIPAVAFEYSPATLVTS